MILRLFNPAGVVLFPAVTQTLRHPLGQLPLRVAISRTTSCLLTLRSTIAFKVQARLSVIGVSQIGEATSARWMGGAAAKIILEEDTPMKIDGACHCGQI